MSKFGNVDGIHPFLGEVSYRHAANVAQLNAQKRAAEHVAVTAFVHQKLDGGDDFRALLHLIEENERFTLFHTATAHYGDSSEDFPGVSSAIKYVLQCRLLGKVELDEIKTKSMVEMLAKLKAAKKTLIVTNEVDEKIYKSARNIEGVKVVTANTICVYDILNCDSFIVLKDAAKKIEEVYA